MKRTAIVALVAVVVSSLCFCGYALADGAIGVKGGGTITNWWGEDSGGADMKFGFLGGANFSYMFTEVLGVQPEILFHRKGMTEEYLGVDITWNLDYIEIPLLMKMAFPTESTIRPSFILGPALAFNMDSTIKGEYGGVEEEEDASDITSGTDVGFVGGFNIDFDVGSAIINVDLRGTLGLMTIDEDGEASVKNSAFSFMLGVMYPLGGAE
jgi:hypothetical protein